LIRDVVLGHAPALGDSLTLVGAVVVGGYALLAWLAATAVLQLTRQGSSARPVAALGALGCLALGLVGGFGIYLVQLASYTQVFAVVAVLAVVLVVDVAKEQSLRSWAVVVAASVALMQSWYLLAPLLLAAGLVVLAELRPRPRFWLALGAVAIIPCLYPLLTGPRSTHADLPGPILLPTIIGVLGLLGSTAMGCATLLRRVRGGTSLALVACTVASLLTLVLLVVKQGFVPGSGVSYYAAKVLLTTFLLGTTVAAGAVAWLLTNPSRTNVALALALAAGVGLATLTTSGDTLPPRVASTKNQLSPDVLDAIVRDHPRGPGPGLETWVLDGCDRVSDLIGSKWLYDTTLSWNAGVQDGLNAYAQAPKHDVAAVQGRLADPAVTHLELYVHKDCDPTALAQLSSDPKVRVIRVP
jgi:hypothetical protein